MRRGEGEQLRDAFGGRQRQQSFQRPARHGVPMHAPPVNHVAFQEPPAGAGAAGVGPEPLSHPNLRVPWSRLLLRPVVITDDSRWFYRSSSFDDDHVMLRTTIRSTLTATAPSSLRTVSWTRVMPSSSRRTPSNAPNSTCAPASTRRTSTPSVQHSKRQPPDQSAMGVVDRADQTYVCHQYRTQIERT